MPEDLDRELADLLRAQALTDRVVAVVCDELMTPARELFGDRAVSWIASTLRMTAEVLDRLDPGGRPPV
jgi:hypothetical protein